MTYRCRICDSTLSDVFVDLGTSPPSNAFVSDLEKPEVWFPLVVYVCSKCLLVQLPQHETPENIFGQEYLYFSGYSASWKKHTEEFAVQVIERFGLCETSLVLEVGSNDGSTLRHFHDRGMRAFGVDPAPNVAAAAREAGIPTRCAFFGEKFVLDTDIRADLIHGANVLAHVPNLHDFVGGLAMACKPDGVVTLEFPSLMSLVAETQFDTIYHEHFSYFTFHTASKILSMHGLEVFDVDILSTHGGSLRLYAALKKRAVSETVKNLFETEKRLGLSEISSFLEVFAKPFQRSVLRVKHELLKKLLSYDGRIAGFGAPAKATTLLNFCGVRKDLLPYVTDDNPRKQGRYMPGSRIPIRPVEDLIANAPDRVLILPWNIKRDALGRLGPLREKSELVYPLGE